MSDEHSQLKKRLEREKKARKKAEFIAEDVTRKLFLKNKELEESNQYKDEFLTLISHELRTPLNGVMLLTESMLNDAGAEAPTPSQKKSLTHIKSNTEDLRIQIDTILEMSELMAGRIQLNQQTTTIEDITSPLIRQYQQKALDKKLQFIVKIAPDIPKDIQTDPEKFQRVIDGLLDNGMKYTSSGFVSLEISTSEILLSHLIICIKDTGIGIPKPLYKKIFHPFHQLDNSTTRAYLGLGIGLTRCKKLVELMGGSINVDTAIPADLIKALNNKDCSLIPSC